MRRPCPCRQCRSRDRSAQFLLRHYDHFSSGELAFARSRPRPARLLRAPSPSTRQDRQIDPADSGEIDKSFIGDVCRTIKRSGLAPAARRVVAQYPAEDLCRRDDVSMKSSGDFVCIFFHPPRISRATGCSKRRMARLTCSAKLERFGRHGHRQLLGNGRAI